VEDLERISEPRQVAHDRRLEFDMNASQPSGENSPARRRFPGWALWLVLVVVLVACHIKFLFLVGHAEDGDFAANSLQVRNAKFFHELYGNYSRWGFHHPGPAFFYVYALGEWLFYDLLKLVPMPFNAHALTDILLQSGFFVWALCIVRARIPHPLIIPLLLVLAGLHFATVDSFVVDSVFGNVWPPYALLFPFLCFVVACASVASGGERDLLAATVAGSLLVHGHVAQPLFVVPCFLLAAFQFLRRGKRLQGSFRAILRRHKRIILLCAAVIALALVPIVLDAARGRESNLRLILQHLSGYSSDRKSLTASLTYFATFFCYVASPEMFCDQITRGSFQFLAERWPFVAAWSAIVLVLLVSARRICRANEFIRWLYGYFVLGAVLTVAWGCLQNGPMFNFNAFFNFGLLFVLLILTAAALCAVLTFKINRFAALPLGLAGLLLFVPVSRGWRLKSDLDNIFFAPQLSGELETAARADGKSQKFLIFPHRSWPNAIGVALALQRIGCDYAISAEWGFMFGREHIRPLMESLASDGPAAWKFTKAAPFLRGFTLNDGTFVSISRGPVDPDGAEIRFIGPEANAPAYVLAGWELLEDKAGQMTGDFGILEFRPAPATRNVELFVLLAGDQASALNWTLRFNQQEVARIPGDPAGRLRFHVPRELWNQRSEARLLFQFSPPLAAGKEAGPAAPQPVRWEKIVFGPAD